MHPRPGDAASTRPALGYVEIEDLDQAALAASYLPQAPAELRQGMAPRRADGDWVGPSPTLGAAPDGSNTAGRSRRYVTNAKLTGY